MAVDRQRLDKWLFFARVVKSRSLAARLVQAARVRVNRDKTEQAAHLIRPGDVLTVLLDQQIRVYRVVDCGSRRGPPAEARTLYEDLSPAPAPRDRSLPEEIVPLRQISAARPTRHSRKAAGGSADGPMADGVPPLPADGKGST